VLRAILGLSAGMCGWLGCRGNRPEFACCPRGRQCVICSWMCQAESLRCVLSGVLPADVPVVANPGEAELVTRLAALVRLLCSPPARPSVMFWAVNTCPLFTSASPCRTTAVLA